MGKYLNNKAYQIYKHFDKNELLDIKNRCRFLRRLNEKEAYRLINTYATVVDRIIRKQSFDLLLGQIMDNYCMDVIVRLCKRRGIKIVNPIVTFINGYSRFTIRGEWIPLCRKVSNDEIENVYNYLMDKKYKGRLGLSGRTSELKRFKIFFRRVLIERAYYPIKKLIENDWYNYHYNTIVYDSLNYSRYVGKKVSMYFDSINNIPFSKKSVFVPLHFTPEATTDYFGETWKFGHYEELMIDFINRSDEDVIFLVKEHPIMMGFRDREFYRALKMHKNVYLISGNEDSNEILNRVETVLTCTGSVGIEALLRGKRVLTMTENFYSKLHPNIHHVSCIDSKSLDIKLCNYDPKAFLKAFLSGLIPVHLYSQTELSKTDTIELANNIRMYFEL